ncbi:LEAF RUST 10 DISEASE-RESISTANCE LOCUS RECEPTOR-LIKE PROTEIN KINASE-like 2.4 isoform X2 [Capsella rubella]|uniref:LEAF RUST 10 DISEASE-RESISTANCE LOCUS RECEPTOR-LIKE PROTEIN KINASE-like 2.4 isoform X2 n=1 Tax=Capsella rubella TaxID=81985 RepID=UPI000CD4B2AD|nr:LEAF RUST 10 DISEASE-RESISTANCE LOCUS RECEPTOR-LIKE PROTEIN KINASE-like 2.4 isoform X2 [Capsella rubella]
MYNLLNSFLVLFFLFFLFHHLPCASSKRNNGWCESQFQCGNITAGFPFWGGTRPRVCGHPLLELSCLDNYNTTSLKISDLLYRVISINYTYNTIRIARTDFLQSICLSSYPFANTTLPREIFDVLPTYKSVTFYRCYPVLPNLARYGCPAIGSVSVSTRLEHPVSCEARFGVNIPTSFVTTEKNLNITNLVSDVRNGFEVKWKIDENSCLECSSSHKYCGFTETFPLDVKCRPIHPPTGATIVGVSLIPFLVLTLVVQIFRKRKTSTDLGQKDLKERIPQPRLKALIPLKQYSYEQVKRITNSFEEVVGRGGFGTVYRGTLSDGRMVAVKILKDLKGNNGEDFINEVSSMSQTSHVNIVTLLGFCSEGYKRAIIYEFMENGSLDKFISSKKSSNMDWSEVYGIALGVARGLEYLHHGCRTRIVHFDIKPQNVLLDDNLSPKVSDFGLAKLCERKESILSLMDTRGTIGYIAPEMFSRVYGRVSHKSDVYSYGMLVLEIIGAKNKPPNEDTSSSTSSMYFPEWIYKDLEKENSGRVLDNGMKSEEDEIEKKMRLVGLWCIQSWPSDRPSMNRVVEMMEGDLDALEVPPRPVLQCSVVPHLDSSWISEEDSISSRI